MRASKEEELQDLKTNVIKCFEAAALSTRSKLKITDKMHYKGILLYTDLVLTVRYEDESAFGETLGKLRI